MFRLLFENQVFQKIEDFQIQGENEILDSALAFCWDWLSGKTVFSQKTSGSTGTPKEITLSKDRLKASAEATGKFFGINSELKLLCCLHPGYIAGKMMLLRAMVWQCEIRLVMPSSEPLSSIPDAYQPDFVAMVPLQVEKTLENDSGKRKLKKLKTLLIGGAPLSESLQRRIASELDNAWQSFGMTETVSHIALAKITEQTLNYQVLPGVKLGADERGALWVESPMSGPETIQTNDLVHFQSNGSFQWLGRLDFVINSGGIKLHPELLERKVERSIQIFFPDSRFIFGGIPDEHLGQKLVLLIESKAKDSEKAGNLREELSKYLDRFSQPKEIIILDKFSETGSGKIDRLKTLANAQSDS